MKPNIIIALLLIAFNWLVLSACNASDRKGLILTKEGITKIQANLGKTPLFDKTLQQLKLEVDAEIAKGIDTPVPRDFSGGYTHQRHKANFFLLQKAGVLFQILADEKYANYVRDMFFQYEAMYKDLPLHPQTRSYARGKLFWQSLNDSNWLVYAAQAYDAIYDWLPASDRKVLEDNLFRPFADHISIDSPQFFNRVHNHSTWGAAAVGMIGLVMQDEELIQRALYGLEEDGLEIGAKDDDGGFLKVEGQGAGFFANLNEPFSPDGYYTEGPYYQRYAMYPFLVFAQALNNARPDLDVLNYKNGVLLKAVDVLLNLSDADGDFFPINDGQKGMSYYNDAVVTAVNIAYFYGNKDPRLLSIAQQQGRVLLDDTGYAVAAGIRDGLAKKFTKGSENYSDGSEGDEGGLGLLRHGDEALTLLFKYTAQGLSHGHYDKLSFSLYGQGEEIMQDYGLARFVNIEQKGGGNYLPENKTWAKQTIAHNTLVQNRTSHFAGKYEIGSQHHSQLRFYDASNENVQVISAEELNAYPGTKMQRTMAMIKDEDFEKAFVLDLFKADAQNSHQYDLPFYYFGQILKSNVDYQIPSSLQPLGDKNGYQHLYLEAQAKANNSNTKFSWLDKGSFYTLTMATEKDDKVLLARIGANDPQFNLRKDPAIIFSRANAKQTLFASVIEPHGSYTPVSESAHNSNSNIAELTVLQDDDNYTAVAIKTVKGNTRYFVVANKQIEKAAKHQLQLKGQTYHWTGPFQYINAK
ncbi:alginate lyase family protein [Colwellia sp. 1_MG-2023]|uniref:alginate lyase family protein n=1 Tax=Colwellia sp. 1_MG-2023 TaxID=3062649 RepID=UPI0026E444A2|nr:alginate lyase family protein [Colwellia sp. 1_MG-2023]MDO6446391.1 alginate lyase family protein [Colwellia sp. 1_MG-2023]